MFEWVVGIALVIIIWFLMKISMGINRLPTDDLTFVEKSFFGEIGPNIHSELQIVGNKLNKIREDLDRHWDRQGGGKVLPFDSYTKWENTIEGYLRQIEKNTDKPSVFDE